MTFPGIRKLDQLIALTKSRRSNRSSAPRRRLRRLLAEQLEQRYLLAGDILLSSNFVYENLPVDSLVGQLTAVDPAGTNPYTFELVSGAGSEDNLSFNIDSGQLVTADSFDDELQSVYSVRIRASDNLGVISEKAFVIDVLDTDGDYHDVLGTSSNDAFSAQYTGSGTNEWLVKRGSTTVFSGLLATPTTKLRILATSGTDTLTIVGTSGNDTFAVDGPATEVNGFTVIGQSVETRHISGGGGSNTLIGPDTDSLWTINSNNRGTLNTSTSFVNVGSLVGGSGDDTFQFSGGYYDYISGTLDTGAGWDTLDYSQYSRSYSVLVSWSTNQATGVGRLGTTAATNFEAVIGSGTTNQTVTGPDAVNQWQITGENTGTINAGQYSFTNIARLQGGPQEDVFVIQSGGSISGYINGSSNDRIELADRSVPVDVNITDRKIPDVLGSFFAGELLIEGEQDNRLVGSTGSQRLGLNANGTVNSNLNTNGTVSASSVLYNGSFTQFVGGSGAESLYAPELDTDWHITGDGTGDGTGYLLFGEHRFDFTATENLYGSDAVDSFTVEVGGSWSGVLLGQGGDDTFNLLDGIVRRIDGGTGNDTFILAGGSANQIFGSRYDNNTLIGPDTDSLWTIDGTNSGTLNTSTSFSDVQSLVGGSEDDTFQFTGGRNDYISGTLNTGTGWDTLDYSQYSVSYSVLVSWSTSQATGVGYNYGNGIPGAAIGFEAVIGSGATSQTVTGPDAVNQWQITGENTGTINAGQYSFTNVARLQGGPQEDVFVIQSGGSISGYINGSSNDRIELADRSVPVDVNVTNRIIPGVLGSFFAGELLIEGEQDNRLVGSTGTQRLALNANGTVNSNLNSNGTVSASSVLYTSGFAQFVGGSGTELLYAPELDTDWHITGDDTGYLLFDGRRFDFTATENLYGSNAVDSFTVEVGGSWSGVLYGEGGDDSFNLLDGIVEKIYGGTGNDTFILAGGSANQIFGSYYDNNTLIGPDTDSLWTIDARNRGTLNTSTSFSDVQSLVGGSEDDTFQFTGGRNDYIDGTLDAGGGWDTLDYSQYSVSYSVFASWSANQATGVGYNYGNGTVGAATGFEAVIGSGLSYQTVEGPDSLNQWTISGENTGTINNGQYSFTNFGSLRGGPQEDVFFIQSGGSISGYLNGSSNDRIELADRGAPVDVNITDRKITDHEMSEVLGSFSAGELLIQGDQDNRLVGSTGTQRLALNANGAINTNLDNYGRVSASSVLYTGGFAQFVGGSDIDVLYAPELDTDWYITGKDTGYLLVDGRRFDFTGTEYFYGSNAVDSFTVEVGGSWSGTLYGQGGDDTFTILGGSVGVINGGTGSNTLIGPDTDSVWTIDGRNRGTLNTSTSFSYVQSLVGGSGDDTFQFTGRSYEYIDGTLDTGGGWDTLDYSQYSVSYSVFASWSANRATGVGYHSMGGGTLGAATNFEAVIGSGATNQTVEGPDSLNQWQISDENTGTINAGQYGFTNFANLRGSPQEDVFFIESGGSYDGSLIGSGGIDRLELAPRNEPLEVSVNSRSIPGVLGSYSLENVVALDPAGNRLLGSEANTIWQVTPIGDILVNSVTYIGFDSILGGSGDDTLLVDYTGDNLDAALQIDFDGGPGGNDGLGFSGGSFNTVTYHPAHGTLQLGDVTLELSTGNQINLTNTAIKNLSISIDQADLVATEIVTTLSNANTTDTLISFSESLGGITVRKVTGRLTILGDAVQSDTIVLTGLGSSLAADVVVDGLGGVDQVRFDDTFILKANADLEVFAEQITTAANVAVRTQGTGRVMFYGDDLELGLTSTIGSETSVTLAPLSHDRDIEMGTGDANSLSLTTSMLNRILAPSLTIGRGDTPSGTPYQGNITIAGDVTLAANTNLHLTTAADISLVGSIDTSGGTLSLRPGDAPHAVQVGLSPNAVIASELFIAPGSNLLFTINGVIANSEYSQLNLTAALDLADINLVIDGQYHPNLKDSFHLINKDGTDIISGVFADLPHGSVMDNFLGSSLGARVSYLGQDDNPGNDVVLTVIKGNLAPIADAGGPYSISEGDSLTLNAADSSDPDGDPLIYAWDLNGDGDFSDAKGVAPIVTWDELVTLRIGNVAYFNVTLAVDDGRAPVVTDSATVNVLLNKPPVANAGGPYFVDVGGSITLDASGSSDDKGIHNLVISWDFDSDGNFDVTGLQPTFSAALVDGSQVLTVEVRVEDDRGKVAFDSTTITVRSLAPTISLDSPITVGQGDLWTASGNFADPGSDHWTATVNYADGSGDQPLELELDDQTFQLEYVYNTAGVYTAVVTIDDGDGGVSSKNLTIDVKPPPLPDLTLISADVKFLPINPGVGEAVEFVVDVTNEGTLVASDVPISVIVQVFDAATESFVEIGRDVINSPIDVDAKGQISLTWDGRIGQPALPSEDAYLLIRVLVDPDSTIEESDESNNEAIQVLQVGKPDFGSAELVADIPHFTAYQGVRVPVGGQAYYKFSTEWGTNDFPVQNASATARLTNSTGKLLAVSGVRTAPNGNFLHIIRAPDQDGDYTLTFEISDGTLSKVFVTTLKVEGVAPQQPPQKRSPAGPGYVFSSSIEFSDAAGDSIPPLPPGNPQIGVPFTILGSFDYERAQPLLGVPVTFNDLFPVLGQMRTFEIGSGEVNFPEGGLIGPALVPMNWTPTAEGYHIIQVIAKPEFEFRAHTHSTRLLLVGNLDTTSLIITHETEDVSKPKPMFEPMMFAAGGFAAPMASMSVAPTPMIPMAMGAGESMGASQTSEPGDTLLFTLRYENTGTTTITGGILIDNFDDTLMGTPTNISHGGIVDGNIVRWELGDIAPGASGSVSYEVTINSSADLPPGSAYLFNTAILNADQAVAAATSELIVDNNAPVITGLSVDEMPDEYGKVNLSGTFSDASTTDTHTIDVDWGDGQTDRVTFTAGERSFSIDYSYDLTNPLPVGNFAINVNITDDSNQIASRSVTTRVPAVDQTNPSSSVRSAIVAPNSGEYIVEVGFQDSPGVHAEAPVSGVSWIDVFYRVDPQNPSSTTQLFGSITVNPSSVSGTATLTAELDASPGQVIQLWSVASDLAGNIEAEITPRTDYSFVTADTVAPQTQVDSAVFDDNTVPFVNLQVSGTDVGGGNVASIEVYVESTPETEGSESETTLVGTISGGANAVSGTLKFPVPQDGVTRSYRFFSIGTDHLGNREADPGSSGGVVLTGIMLTTPESKQIIGFDVNDGLENRSSIHSVDLLFNDESFIADLLDSLNDGDSATDRIRLERLDLDGERIGGGEFLPISAVQDGMQFRLNFGGTGLQQNGVYAIRVDMDGNVSNGFEELRRFHRLQGDVNGDGVVDTVDLQKVRQAYRNPALYADADVDGDGDVDSTDLRFHSTFLRKRDAEKALGILRGELDD